MAGDVRHFRLRGTRETRITHEGSSSSVCGLISLVFSLASRSSPFAFRAAHKGPAVTVSALTTLDDERHSQDCANANHSSSRKLV